MPDTQPIQNTKNESSKEEPKRSVAGKVSDFLIKVLTEGLGAAFGVAIVVFVGYTVMGVYHQGEASKRFQQQLDGLSTKIEQISTKQETLAHDIFVVKTDGLSSKKELEDGLKERSAKLREEIIESNQVALQLFMEQSVSFDKKDEALPKDVITSPPLIINGPDGPVILNPTSGNTGQKSDALKYRFRQEQQKVQQQW